MAQSKFKTGDRVENSLQGVVLGYTSDGYVDISWDNGEEWSLIETRVRLVQDCNKTGTQEVKPCFEPTIKFCIDFLISQGYSVTFGK